MVWVLMFVHVRNLRLKNRLNTVADRGSRIVLKLVPTAYQAQAII